MPNTINVHLYDASSPTSSPRQRWIVKRQPSRLVVVALTANHLARRAAGRSRQRAIDVAPGLEINESVGGKAIVPFVPEALHSSVIGLVGTVTSSWDW